MCLRMPWTPTREVMIALTFGLFVSACSTVGNTPDPTGTGDSRSRLSDLGYQQVTLEGSGYWGGSFEWMAPREGLTREQSEALAGLEPIRGKVGCPQDIQE